MNYSLSHSRIRTPTMSASPSPFLNFRTLIETFSVKVLKTEARPLNVPLISPFTIASSRLECVENVAIKVELADGCAGWGEAPVLPSVTAEDQLGALEKATEVGDFLRGSHAMSLGAVLGEVGRVLPGHQFASVRAGVEMALIDAVATSIGVPLCRLFGGVSNTITTDITIPIVTPSEAADLASKYRKEGFKTLKLKVGKNLEGDIQVLQAIRMAHPDCSFILDANEGYTSKEAIIVLERLHGMEVRPILFEQPVHRDDWDGLGEVYRVAKNKYGVAVAADESCRSLVDVKRIVDDNLADVINIKLAKLGVIGALEIIEFARASGLDLMIGGMVETRLAMGFAGHLAAGLGCFKFIDLDTPLLLSEDPVLEGYEVSGPIYKFTNSRGHGGFLQWDNIMWKLSVSLLSPFSLGLIIRILFFLIDAITLQAVDDVHYSECSKLHSCGPITEIKYPFWGSDRPSYCGLQGYEIMCRENVSIFEMNLQLFVVRNIERLPYTMIIAREDLFYDIYHSNLVDTTINLNLVNYSSTPENLTLFYSCPSYVSDSAEPKEKFTCRDNHSVIAFLEDTVWYEASQKCEKNIKVPVTQENMQEFEKGNSLWTDLIKKGFEVDYETQPKMQKCENSGGVCGTNSRHEFTCFCKDVPRDLLCPGKSNVILQSIGIGASIIVGLLLLFGILCYYHLVEKEFSKWTRAKFFDENGGKLLQQQLLSAYGSVEKTKLFKSFELEKATNFYNVDRVLGKGGQGTVYKGVLSNGRLVAVKKSKVLDKSSIGHFINEIVILSQINHRNVVNLLGCCLETKVPLPVYELIPNGTLFQHIHNPTKEFPLNWGVRLQIAAEIAGALSYLHSAASRPIYHRDIKSTNILLDDGYNAKVSDFGISRLVGVGNTHLTTHVKGTFGYLDPEYFLSHQLNEKSDVYSFGVVLVELLTGQKPIISGPYQESKGLASLFMESMDDNHLFEIIDQKLSKEDKIEEIVEVAHLAKACLNSKGKKRPTMKEVTIQLEGMRTLREQSMPRENDESNVVGEAYDDSSSSTVAWDIENPPSLNDDINSLPNLRSMQNYSMLMKI